MLKLVQWASTAFLIGMLGVATRVAPVIACDLDPTFGTGGVVTTTVGEDGDGVQAIVLQPDGKVVAAGYARLPGQGFQSAVLRYDSEGNPDPTFGGGGIAVTQAGAISSGFNAVLRQPDGKIVAAGHSDFQAFSVARYNSDGTLDPTFGTSGIVLAPFEGADAAGYYPAIAYGLVLQPDGKLIVAGEAPTPDRINSFALARYSSDGTLDPSFGSNGVVLTSVGADSSGASSIVRQLDGKIVAAGYARSTFQGDTSYALARYDSDGALDSSFGIGGVVTTSSADENAFVNALLLQPDGGLLAVGGVSNATYTMNFTVARYTAAGTLDTSFGTGGIATTPLQSWDNGAMGGVLQPDGKIVVVGSTQLEDSNDFASVVLRYESDGSLDPMFGIDGMLINSISGSNGADYLESVLRQTDGTLVAAGRLIRGDWVFFHTLLARYLPDNCGSVVGPPCGDGHVDADEQCDDGADNGKVNSCCTSTCTFQPRGTACAGGACAGEADTCMFVSNIISPDVKIAAPLTGISAGYCLKQMEGIVDALHSAGPTILCPALAASENNRKLHNTMAGPLWGDFVASAEYRGYIHMPGVRLGCVGPDILNYQPLDGFDFSGGFTKTLPNFYEATENLLDPGFDQPLPTYELAADRRLLKVTYRLASRISTAERLAGYTGLGFDAPFIWTVLQENVSCTGTSIRVRQSVLPTLTVYVNDKRVAQQRVTKSKLGAFTASGGGTLHDAGTGKLAPYCKPSIRKTIGKAPPIIEPSCRADSSPETCDVCGGQDAPCPTGCNQCDPDSICVWADNNAQDQQAPSGSFNEWPASDIYEPDYTNIPYSSFVSGSASYVNDAISYVWNRTDKMLVLYHNDHHRGPYLCLRPGETWANQIDIATGCFNDLFSSHELVDPSSPTIPGDHEGDPDGGRGHCGVCP